MRTSQAKLFALLNARERRSLAILLALMVMEAALEMLSVAVVPVYITALAYPEQLAGHALLQGRLTPTIQAWMTRDHLLVWGGVGLLALYAIKTGYSVALAYWRARFAQNRALKISLRLFTAYLRAPYVFHLRHNSAELQRNINQECTQLAVRVLMPMVEFVSHLLVLCGITAVLVLILDLRVLAWLVAFLAVGLAFASLLQNRVKRLGIEAQAHRGTVIRSVTEGLGGVKEIQLLQRAGYFVDRLRVALANVFRIGREVQVMSRATPQVIELTGILGLVGVTLMLFRMGATNQEIIATLSVFAVALTRLKGAVRGLLDTHSEVRHNAASLDIVHDGLAELEPVMHPPCAPGDSLPLREALSLEGLGFRHEGAAADSLRDVSLRITRGEAVGFVGPSGAGKSTLLDLVLGVLQPTRGCIRVDGVDIRGALGAWQNGLGYVPQALFLIDGTLTENIALGVAPGEVDAARLARAVAAAELSPLVARLPQGLATVIGEDGIRLSGGERQRIAIARALYHEPAVLVLDEATSALDSTTEAAVIQAVAALRGERTILMIAHRLSTVRRCDRIVFLKDGRIDAIGSYEELARDHVDFRTMLEPHGA